MQVTSILPASASGPGSSPGADPLVVGFSAGLPMTTASGSASLVLPQGPAGQDTTVDPLLLAIDLTAALQVPVPPPVLLLTPDPASLPDGVPSSTLAGPAAPKTTDPVLPIFAALCAPPSIPILDGLLNQGPQPGTGAVATTGPATGTSPEARAGLVLPTAASVPMVGTWATVLPGIPDPDSASITSPVQGITGEAAQPQAIPGLPITTPAILAIPKNPAAPDEAPGDPSRPQTIEAAIGTPSTALPSAGHPSLLDLGIETSTAQDPAGVPNASRVPTHSEGPHAITNQILTSPLAVSSPMEALVPASGPTPAPAQNRTAIQIPAPAQTEAQVQTQAPAQAPAQAPGDFPVTAPASVPVLVRQTASPTGTPSTEDAGPQPSPWSDPIGRDLPTIPATAPAPRPSEKLRLAGQDLFAPVADKPQATGPAPVNQVRSQGGAETVVGNGPATAPPPPPAPSHPIPPAIGPRTPAANPLDLAVTHQVGRAMLRHGPDGDRSLVIRLTPPELGTVRLELREHQGQLVATLRAEDAGVQRALERGLPSLRQDLRTQDSPVTELRLERQDQREQGGSPGDGRQQGAWQQAAQQQEGRRDGQPRFSLDAATLPAAPVEETPTILPRSIQPQRVGDDGVDARA